MDDDDGLTIECFMLAQAWWLQCDTGLHEPTDVDMEAVSVLQQSIFTHSDESGVTGNQQWGLDIGPLQDGWYQYGDTPYYWRTRVGNDDENELAHGPGYQFDMEAVPAAQPVSEPVAPKEMPKPRPVPRRR
ncbi:hypothetical protein C8J56DRAFT_1048851 [Mycena floridula]|nr:hypothetical protein C8J56DRAFT_1048851 [Mycena floridula]